MKYVKQLHIIFTITFIAEALKFFLPFPIPASISGMVLLFFCLVTNIIKLDSVKETGLFFIEIMPLLFIPAGVGLISSWPVLKPLLLPIAIIMVVSTFTVFGASSKVCELIITKQEQKENK